MKRLSICLIILLFTINSYTQENENRKLTEIKVNGLELLAGYIDVHAEKISNDRFSYGASLILNLVNGNDNYVGFAVYPYLRQHFGEGKAKGFFIEAGMPFAAYGRSRDEDGFKFGIGLSFGTKVLTKKNLVIDFNIGAGAWIDGTHSDIPPVFPRVGVTIGKRF